MKPGIYSAIDLDIEDYHAHRESISRTPLLEFMESPYRYWAQYLKPDAPKKNVTPAMVFGSAFHTLILEPHLFAERYAVKPQAVLLKDVGREQYDFYKHQVAELEKTHKFVLPFDMMVNLREMEAALKANPKAWALVEGGVYEESYFWEDPHSGLVVKARPDILHENIYVDIKTISDASPQNYQREMVKFGYHIQGAMVKDARRELRGIKETTVINLVCEKEYPHSVVPYIIDPAAIDEGHMQYKQTLLDMKNARETNHYPDYEPMTIGLPTWAIK